MLHGVFRKSMTPGPDFDPFLILEDLRFCYIGQSQLES
jgi:hypothetical protein